MPETQTIEQAVGALRRVGRSGRRVLLLHRLAQLLAAVLVIAVTLGVLDFVLRLPGALRMVIGLMVLAGLGVWAVSRFGKAWGFHPDLDRLALRAERMQPRLAGRLSPAVAFAIEPERYAVNDTAKTLMDASIDRAEEQLIGVDFGRLLDRSHLMRSASVLGVAVLVVGMLVGMAPGAASTAAARWLNPFGSAAWPARVVLEHAPVGEAWPADTPLPIDAEVVKGASRSLRVNLVYRWENAFGEVTRWQRQPLERDDAGEGASRYRLRLSSGVDVDVPVDPGKPEMVAGTIEYRLEAGDARTPVYRVSLVPPPTVASMGVYVEPPAYAGTLLSAERYDLLDNTLPVSILPGSTVRLSLAFNKPVAQSSVQAQVGGLGEVVLEADPGAYAMAYRAAWVHGEAVVLQPGAVDAYGLSVPQPSAATLGVLPDAPPMVVLPPLAHPRVLPGALVELSTEAEDDVGLEWLRLEGFVRQAESEDAAGVPDAAEDALLTPVEERRARRLEASASVDLRDWAVEPGDRVLIVARAQDVYLLDGLQHPLAVATRELWIIDEAAFMQDVQREFAQLRSRIVPVRSLQEQARSAEADRAQSLQQRVVERLNERGEQLQQIVSRVEQNRLENPGLDAQLDAASSLMQQAQEAAQEASENLQSPEEQAQQIAREAQAQAERRLEELLQVLDAGRAALALAAEIRQIQALQEDLLNETQALQQRTAGVPRDQLSEEDRTALDDLSQRQQELRERASDAVQQMQDVARAMQAQSPQSPSDQAAAESLAEAANIAQEQQLDESMEDATEQLDENQLTPARGSQTDALNTLEQMSRELGRQAQRQQEILRQRLADLAETLERLIARQREALQTTRAAEPNAQLGGFVPNQTRIREQAMVAVRDAEAQEQTRAAAGLIQASVDAMADAVRSMQRQQRPFTEEAQMTALTRLQEALDLIRQAQEQLEQEQADANREKLRQAYLELAERQEAMIATVHEIVPNGVVTRRERPQLAAVGNEEEALADEARALGDQVADTVVFSAMHARIEADAVAATGGLRRGESVPVTTHRMQRVADRLRRMAAALEDPEDQEPFDRPQQSGGGGGGGGEPELVPPLAELRLLRGWQEDVLAETRFVDQQARDWTPGERGGRLQELSTQQTDLRDLAQAMIEALSQ